MFLLAFISLAKLSAIFWVAIGLGAVIFVHELGHFLVAKLCGVRCDKFYIGFDVPIKIGPLKLPSAIWKKKWGETEYGIGILPLGGYVKMFGQDDNPANIAEEMKQAEVDAEGAEEKKAIIGPSGETYYVHPRSYLAQSVPERMAIISAGVIMNVIFAFIFAFVAYGLGVPYTPCGISGTAPGSPAWKANLPPGSEIVQIGDNKSPMFGTLREEVLLGDYEKGVDLYVKKPGNKTPEKITIVPRKKKESGIATIGVMPPISLILADPPANIFAPAGHAKWVSGKIPNKAKQGDDSTNAEKQPEGLQGGDIIVAINGNRIADYAQFAKALATHRNEAIEVTVVRGSKTPKENPNGKPLGGTEITYKVEPRPMKRLGLVMEMGKVVAVQKGSPTTKVPDKEEGLQEGDFIVSMNRKVIGDPVTWPERARQLAESDTWIELVIKRKSKEGEDKEITIENIKGRVPEWFEQAGSPLTPMPCTSLGIAYHIVNRVDRVLPGSPAEKAGLQSGDFIVQAKFIKGKDDTRKGYDFKEPIEFGEGKPNWPYFMSMLQSISPETTVELEIKRGEETKKITLSPTVLAPSEESLEVFLPYRGFSLTPIVQTLVADTIKEQLSLGLKKTWKSLTSVYRFLSKIGTNIPITAMGGPVTIASASYASAQQGAGALLVFLTMLSANLAVINFLPIPLLDGGHMVFLIYEGIRGRPPKENFVVVLHMIGFAFLIGLMLFVFALDLGLINRNL